MTVRRIALVCFCVSACSSSGGANASDAGSGNGGGATGGQGTGAAPASTGGTTSTGGATNTGGTTSTGGATNTGGASGSGGATEPFEAGPPPPNPCLEEGGSCPPGTWIDVTPASVDLKNQLDCGNYGTETMAADAKTPGVFYTLFMCQGIFESTDYGQNWKGPINTGSHGSDAGDCAGGITIAPKNSTSPPIIYEACIRGNGNGFWKSTNGGVDWTNYNVAPGGARQDFYPPVVDPYDEKHLLMPGHEMNVLVESADGGETWTAVNTDAGMQQDGGTAEVFFVDTGDATTTRTTFLWLAQQSTKYGTWRTTNDGANWTKVDKNEHPHGTSQIFQPDSKGVVYMAGAYSDFGWGVLRSADYGVTWAHVGSMGSQAVVFGTENDVYAMSSGAVSLGTTLDPTFETSAAPGTGTWTMPGTPAGMTVGAAQAAVTNDGTHDIIVTANWGAGIWRYIEP
jgi:hypothetical protein